jgi:hypothetical protein
VIEQHIDPKTLKELVAYAQTNTHLSALFVPVEKRRELLGTFLGLDEMQSAMLGSYDLETGEWRLRNGRRGKTLIHPKL